MRFAPKPENDFVHYIRIYYDECRSRFNSIEAIAGKWMFRDLIPGMSDFDTRFIVADGMRADDWCRMSMAVGEAHLALCRRYPAWWRNLEHLPGINLTWSELLDERSYYPEYRQWSFYHTVDPARLGASLQRLARRPWDAKDEHFHLKKFCLFYGRYDRTIDPAVNLGAHENKYPLHSRLMHYFCPAVQSAMCLLERRHFVGKFEALEHAARRFPDLACWDAVWSILGATYETPEWYTEVKLAELEDLLEEALAEIARELRGALTLLPHEAGADVAAWKRALTNAPVDPALVILDNAKFSRLMKGRLFFYAHAPAQFDTAWLIRNELQRIGRNFFHAPFRAFWALRTGRQVDNPADVLDALAGDPLSEEEIASTRAFDRLTRGWREGEERATALAIVEIFDGFFSALDKVCRAVLAAPPPSESGGGRHDIRDDARGRVSP